MDEKKLKKLVKTYNKPENCTNIITPKCNEETWVVRYSIQVKGPMT